jgi:hypothetical protein
MALKGAGKQAISKAMREMANFRHGNLSGRWCDKLPETGQLPEAHRDMLNEDIENEGSQYVIFSYNTPIAWKTNGWWYIPDIKYSTTTTNHQGVVLVEAGHPGFYAEVKW